MAIRFREIVQHEESILRPLLIGCRIFGPDSSDWGVVVDIHWVHNALLIEFAIRSQSNVREIICGESGRIPKEWVPYPERISFGSPKWTHIMDGYGVDVDLMDILGDG